MKGLLAPERLRRLRFYTLEIPKKVETYEVVETIKHEETNPYSLVAFAERNVIITQSALVGERVRSLWWKAGPWHFEGSLAVGGFSHHLRCHKSCRRVNALSSMPAPVRYFLSAQLAATFGDRESIWSSKGRDGSESLKSSFHLAFSELTRRGKHCLIQVV